MHIFCVIPFYFAVFLLFNANVVISLRETRKPCYTENFFLFHMVMNPSHHFHPFRATPDFSSQGLPDFPLREIFQRGLSLQGGPGVSLQAQLPAQGVGCILQAEEQNPGLAIDVDDGL